MIHLSVTNDIHQSGMPVDSVIPQLTESCEKSDSIGEMSLKSMSISIDGDNAAIKERRQSDEMEFHMLCVDLRTLPSYAQFLTCCGGVFLFFLLYGYCQVCEFIE